jgi:twitching motility protein PilT
MRFIPFRIRTIEELNLSHSLHRFSKLKQGFVLITGPAGHGKSTTLAAIVDEINHQRKDHIITIEDPIEYVFLQDKSIVDQREVSQDTKSFHRALRSTLRQDPDVIMVGEMRDYESISIALTAAETGHLVLSTLHTNSAAQTIDRIIDVFPADQQHQVRVQLAAVLGGIISQRLIQRIEGGRFPACEVMIGTPAISNIIRERRTHEINMVISTSSEKGMISLNRSLANLVIQRETTLEEALKYSLNPSELRLMLKMR